VHGETGVFGLEGIMQEVAKAPGGGLDLLDRILQSVRTFSGGRPLEDDCTLLTANISL
jgi:hypothetical protein